MVTNISREIIRSVDWSTLCDLTHCFSFVFMLVAYVPTSAWLGVGGWFLSHHNSIRWCIRFVQWSVRGRCCIRFSFRTRTEWQQHAPGATSPWVGGEEGRYRAEVLCQSQHTQHTMGEASGEVIHACFSLNVYFHSFSFFNRL